jgi:hypothetical protein
MATLAESFLADLEDLSDDEPEEAGSGEGEGDEDDGMDDVSGGFAKLDDISRPVWSCDA